MRCGTQCWQGSRGRPGVSRSAGTPSHTGSPSSVPTSVISAPGPGSWVLALSCWLCPGQGGRRRLGGRRRIVPSCVCVCPGAGALWVCLTEAHMPASRHSAVGFALPCVPTRLPVWLGYKCPRSMGSGQHVQVQPAGAGLWPCPGAVCGPRVSWCLRLCLTVGCCGQECP